MSKIVVERIFCGAEYLIDKDRREGYSLFIGVKKCSCYDFDMKKTVQSSGINHNL